MLYRTILVPFDGSESSWQALRKAISLARQVSASLAVLSVVESVPHYAATVDEVDDEKDRAGAYFAKVQAEAAAMAKEQGVELSTTTVVGHAAQAILSYAEEQDFDLIVMGHGGHSSVWGTLLGGTTDRVVDQARCDVLVVRPPQPARPARQTGRSVEGFSGDLRVRDVMTTRVTTLTPDTPLREAVRLLVSRAFRAAPVVDAQGRVVGIITNGDLVERGGLRLRVEMLRTLTRDSIAQELASLEEGKTVGDVMTRDVVTVRPEATLAEAAHMMVSRQLKRLPVTRADGTLLGIVSRLDLLQTRARVSPAEEPESPARAGRTIGDVMRTDVPTVAKEAPLSEVLDAVASTRLNRALVLDDDRRVVGLVTDAELTRRLSPRDHPGLVRVLMSRLPFARLSPDEQREFGHSAGTTAEQLMIPNIPTVPPDMPVAEAIAVMLREKRKLLPVVDAEGRLLGAVDRADLLRILPEDDGLAQQ
mgnify:CR=1 FL=1